MGTSLRRLDENYLNITDSVVLLTRRNGSPLCRNRWRIFNPCNQRSQNTESSPQPSRPITNCQHAHPAGRCDTADGLCLGFCLDLQLVQKRPRSPDGEHLKLDVYGERGGRTCGISTRCSLRWWVRAAGRHERRALAPALSWPVSGMGLARQSGRNRHTDRSSKQTHRIHCAPLRPGSAIRYHLEPLVPVALGMDRRGHADSRSE